MIMKKPEADVIRFSGSDIVAASTLATTMNWTNFGDNTVRNGVVSYNGQTYTIDSADSIRNLYNAMSGLGVNSSTKVDNTDKNEKMSSVLKIEAGIGATGTDIGVKSPLWNGTYEYNSVNNIFTKTS